MGSPTENQDVAGLHKTPTGIEGFDLITGGGLPRNRTSLILGGPGAGKTVFALQTLVNGARANSASRASSSPSKRIPARF
jgi:predicted ATP-dependent serine protease